MATVNLTKVITNYPHAQNVNEVPIKKISAVFNAADSAVVKGSALAIADVFELISVPVGAHVLTVAYQVAVAEGGTFTFEIGDGANTDGYSTTTAVEGNALSTGSSLAATVDGGYGVGKFYSAADTIDLKIVNGTPAKAVVKVTATFVDTLGASG